MDHRGPLEGEHQVRRHHERRLFQAPTEHPTPRRYCRLGRQLGQREESFGAAHPPAEPSAATPRAPRERHFGAPIDVGKLPIAFPPRRPRARPLALRIPWETQRSRWWVVRAEANRLRRFFLHGVASLESLAPSHADLTLLRLPSDKLAGADDLIGNLHIACFIASSGKDRHDEGSDEDAD